MSSGALRRLVVEHLRGSVRPFELTFEKGKKLTIVYGENGTGKSTICDAFEFLGDGKVGSLENRGLGRTNRYWASVGKQAADVSVSLETADGSCRASLARNGTVIASPPDQKPRIMVLPRAQILSLIEATPGERYKAIERFVDVSGVEASEAALRTLIKDIADESSVAVARLSENLTTIRQFWEQAGRPGSDPLAWAAAEVQRESSSKDAEIASINALSASFVRLTEYPDRLAAAARTVAEATAALTAAETALAAQLAAATAENGEVVALLQAARHFLATSREQTACPVCESPQDADRLSERIDARLAASASLQHAQAQVAAAREVLRLAERDLDSLRTSVRRSVDAFQVRRADPDLPPDVPLPAAATPTSTRQLAEWLTEHAHLTEQWRHAVDQRRDHEQFVATLERVLNTTNENREIQQELEVLIPRLRAALEIVETERKQFTDATLSAIAEEVARLYEVVHPGEGRNAIRLALDPARRASLEIGVQFENGTAGPPQAYFSDSHLDTLGLCIFLAVAGLDAPENTVLILDDVLGSVDEPHVDRLIEMVYEEAARFRHCILTTHYRPWKHKYRWGWLKPGSCQFVELARWTSATGLTLIRSVPNVDRLRQCLAADPPDPRAVCAEAGVILEAALDFLTLLYACSMPRRLENTYTLGELLPAIDRKLKTALRVEVQGVDSDGRPAYSAVALAPVLDELSRLFQLRNAVGAHFNPTAFELSEADGLLFGTKVLELMDALTDEQAGWPRNNKSGSYWATSGETRRLHPLQKPG